MENKISYGKINIGSGTPLEKEIEISNYIQSEYDDGKLITVSETNDEYFFISIENKKDTGQVPIGIYLNKQDFTRLIIASNIYWGCKEEDIEGYMQKIIEEGNIKFSCSDNLNPIVNLSFKDDKNNEITEEEMKKKQSDCKHEREKFIHEDWQDRYKIFECLDCGKKIYKYM